MINDAHALTSIDAPSATIDDRSGTADEGLTARRARELRAVLRDDPRCRRMWKRHVHRARDGEIHQAAVARVLAVYLWEVGEVSRRDEELPRRLKDRVARALRGTHLQPDVLRLFVDAFDMDARTEARILNPPSAEDPGSTDPRSSGLSLTPALDQHVPVQRLHVVDGEPGRRQLVAVQQPAPGMPRPRHPHSARLTLVQG